MRKPLPMWLRAIAITVVLVSGALATYANYITVKAYHDSKKDTDDTDDTTTKTA